jgi:hypothetical protein
MKAINRQIQKLVDAVRQVIGRLPQATSDRSELLKRMPVEIQDLDCNVTRDCLSADTQSTWLDMVGRMLLVRSQNYFAIALLICRRTPGPLTPIAVSA